jgi:sugar lactone lactonase YvrE
LWGGGCVDRYDAQGRRVQRIDVPARQPSDCCLVDGRLVITTARRDVHEPGPHDGQLLVADVGVSGPPVTPYRGVLPA